MNGRTVMDIALRPMDEDSIEVIKRQMDLSDTDAIRYALSVTAYLVRESYKEGQEVHLDIRAVA
jgi:hypothetical protein